MTDMLHLSGKSGQQQEEKKREKTARAKEMAGLAQKGQAPAT
tara:strand:- start:45345 stop:45470 length:126 start_codon:yes stop_codon:yes gene_type:complete